MLLLLPDLNKGRATKLVHPFPSPLHLHRPRPCWIAVLPLLLDWNKDQDTKLVHPIFTPPSPPTKTLLDCCVATPSRLEQGPRHQVGAPISFTPPSPSTETVLDCRVATPSRFEQGPSHQVGAPISFTPPSPSTKTLLDCCIATPSRLEQGSRHQVGAPNFHSSISTDQDLVGLLCCYSFPIGTRAETPSWCTPLLPSFIYINQEDPIGLLYLDWWFC